MSVLSSIKKWFKKTFGGSGSSGKSSSSGRSRSSSAERASRVSNYGGGGSRSYRDYSSGRYKADYEDRREREKHQRQEQAQKRQATTDALAAISKRTDALSSGKSPSVAASATHATSGQGTAKVIKKIEQKSKATPPDPKQKRLENSKTLQQIADDTKKNRAEFDKKLKQLPSNIRKDRESYHKATGNKYNPATGNKAHDSEARRRVKSGDYQSDPNAARWEYEAHPRATMALRTAANAAAFGVPDVVIRKAEPYMKPELRESEDLYREAQDKYKGTRMAAELAGALVGYGGTANAFERAGARAVERAAATRAGRRLGADALRRTMAGTGTKAALTRSLVGDAIQDSTLGLLDTATDVAERDDLKTPADYAKAIAEGQLLNYGMGLAGNAVAHGLPVAGRAWRNFADESRKLRFVPDGIGSGLTDDGRRLIMNGGTSRSTRLSGWGAESGFAPKRLGRAAKTTPPTEAAPQRTTADILQGYSSRGSKKKLSEAEKRIKQFVAVGDTKAAREEVNRVVDEVVRNTKVEAPVDDTIKEIKATLKNTPISVSDKGKFDAGYASGSFNEFRKGNFGSLTIRNDGTPVDDVWMALQERYGATLFPDDIANPSDQLQYLADLAKSKNKQYYDLMDDEIDNLRNELSENLWESANKGNDHAPWNMRDEDWLTERAATSPLEAEELAEMERRAMEQGDIGSTPSQFKAEDFFETLDSEFPAEAWLGRYGHITRNDDGTYNLFVNGYGDKTLNREQVESYIDDAVKRLNADEAPKSAKPKAEPPRAETETKAEAPKTRKRKPSKSEQRLKEVREEIKASDAEVERLKAEGKEKESIEQIRAGLKLRDEAKKLERNIRRAEKAREKRATDKAAKEFLDKKAAKKAAETKVETKAEAKAEAKAEEPKATPKTEEPKSEIVANGEATEAGKNTESKSKSGERTEFRRGEGETAKEKARNKRTAENKSKATQESFDKDFADFEKKVNENRAKASQLEGRLRAAATAEEKQAIRDEIRALDDEIKRMHRKASLKYHPDRGGSNEWMQKFNGLYDDYTKRVYSSRGFKGASSKSSSSGTSGARSGAYQEYRQRYRSSKAQSGSTPPPKSGAGNGGGGKTPPPRGGDYSDYDGLRRPKGYAKRTQRAMHSVEDMVGASKTKKTWRESLRIFRDESDRKFVDSMKDFEQVARERKKTEGKGAMQKLYGAIDKARRYKAVSATSVGSHQMKWDGTRYQVEGKDGVMRDAPSIAEIFSGMDKDTEKSFNAYLLLNHNVDRLREGKPIFDKTVIYNGELSRELGLPKDIDLMDADVCKKLAQDYEARFPDFQDRASQLRQYTANELNNRVKSGLLSQETMDEWLHKYPNYVPTYRDGLFDSVSTIKGSTVTAGDLKAAKGSDLNIYDIKEQLADATTRNWRDMTLNNLLEKTFGNTVARNLGDIAGNIEGAHILALDHTMNVGKAAGGGKYYAQIFRGGKAERVEIDKRFYDDIKDLYANGRMGNGLDVLNDRLLVPLADKWKKLITEWSPIFMVKNAMRDFPEAIINSRSRKEFLEITADGSALKDLLHNGQFSQSLRDAGISASTFIDIDKAVKAFEKGEGGLKTLIPRLNAGVEMYPRLVEYMATLKKAGYDLKKVDIKEIPIDVRDMAAANAADVTVNFGRSGSVGKMINKGAIPFFNPSIQGWSKFARNISELDGMKDTLGFLLSATALGAAPMVATNLLYQNNPNYQQISPRDKAGNYIIAIPPYDDNADKFIKIPRSRFASVYGLPLVNIANENKASWAEAIQIVNDQVAPLNPIESHLGANLIQASRNKTWYGTPIESESMQSLPANERYDATTSSISVGAADILNKASKGKVKVSPKKLDYVLDANFGVIADVGLPLFTKSKKEGNVANQVANVGKRAFMIDATTQNNLSSRYYDQSTLLEQTKNSKDATDADKLAYTKFKSWDSRVKGVTNAMRYIQNSDLPNKQEAYRELAKLRNDNMLKALDGKTSLNNTRDIDIIHKYAGTSYTIENLGKSADQKALKAYGAAVYGDLSDDEMRKRIDSDTEFYKGYKGIAKTQNALQKIDPKLKGANALTYAVGLADAGANDDVFASYNTTVKSRTESASKADRAKEYLSNNGSVEEFAQLENAVKNLGKLSDVDKGKLEDEAYTKLKRGEMSIDDYNTELKKIDYNANMSYVGKSVSLALSGAPARAYKLYDIKGKNVQKGYNLAAMGIDSRQYREMSKACDKDGNGYLKTAEIRDYVANSDYEDKATLFDALCYYSRTRNPFGTPKKYSAEQAAELGKKKGVKQIKANAGADNTVFDEDASKGGRYGGYYRRGRGWRRWGRGGHSSKAKVPAPKTIKASSFVKGEALVSKKRGSNTTNVNPKLERVKAKIDLPEAKW